jgi:hypothetical protein
MQVSVYPKSFDSSRCVKFIYEKASVAERLMRAFFSILFFAISGTIVGGGISPRRDAMISISYLLKISLFWKIWTQNKIALEIYLMISIKNWRLHGRIRIWKLV